MRKKTNLLSLFLAVLMLLNSLPIPALAATKEITESALEENIETTTKVETKDTKDAKDEDIKETTAKEKVKELEETNKESKAEETATEVTSDVTEKETEAEAEKEVEEKTPSKASTTKETSKENKEQEESKEETTTTKATEIEKEEEIKETEAEVDKIIAATSAQEFSDILATFDSKRILLKSDLDLNKYLDNVLGVKDGKYQVLNYKSQNDLERIKKVLDKLDVFYIIDKATVKTNGENFTSEDLEKFYLHSDNKLAIIDTGSNSADSKLSVLDHNGEDANGHGTFMTNIIKNISDSHVTSIKALDKRGRGQISDVFAALNLIKNLDVDAVLMAMSMPDRKEAVFIKDIIKELSDNNIKIVASAGNNDKDASNYVPANLDEVITVGSLNEDLSKNKYSNYGPKVDAYVVEGTTSAAAARFIAMMSVNQFKDTYKDYKIEDIEDPEEPIIDEGDIVDDEFTVDATIHFTQFVHVKAMVGTEEAAREHTRNMGIIESQIRSALRNSIQHGSCDVELEDPFTYADLTTGSGLKKKLAMLKLTLTLNLGPINNSDVNQDLHRIIDLGKITYSPDALRRAEVEVDYTNLGKRLNESIIKHDTGNNAVCTDNDGIIKSNSHGGFPHPAWGKTWCIEPGVNYNYRPTLGIPVTDAEAKNTWGFSKKNLAKIFQYVVNGGAYISREQLQEHIWKGLENKYHNIKVRTKHGNVTYIPKDYEFPAAAGRVVDTRNPNLNYNSKAIPTFGYELQVKPGGTYKIVDNNNYLKNLGASKITIQGASKSQILVSSNNNVITIRIPKNVDPSKINNATVHFKNKLRTGNIHENYDIRKSSTAGNQNQIGGYYNRVEDMFETKASIKIKSYPRIHLQKQAQHNVFKDLNTYSLSGATFGLYKTKANAENDKNRLFTFKANASGKTNVYQMQETDVTYYIKELKAGPGYLRDPKVHTITIKGFNDQSFKVNNTPTNDPLRIKIEKESKEGFDEFTKLSMDGTEFTMWYMDSYADYNNIKKLSNQELDKKAKKKFVYRLKNDKRAFTVHDADFLVQGEFYKYKGTAIFPLGSYIIRETKAAPKYRRDPHTYFMYLYRHKDATTSTQQKTYKSWAKPTQKEVEETGGVLEIKNPRIDPYLLQEEKHLEGKLHFIKSIKNNKHLVDIAPKLYDLNNTAFEIYRKDTGILANSFKVDSNGVIKDFKWQDGVDGSRKYDPETQTFILPTGDYYIKEVESTKGYYLEDKPFEFTIKLNETTEIDFKNEPMFTDFKLVLEKIIVEAFDSDQTDDDMGTWDYSLKNAIFDVSYYNDIYDLDTALDTEPTKKWRFKTDSDGKITYDAVYLFDEELQAKLKENDNINLDVLAKDLFVNDDGNYIGLQGTYLIEEVLAPRGLSLNEDKFLRQIRFDKNIVKGSDKDPMLNNLWNETIYSDEREQIGSEAEAPIVPERPQEVNIIIQKLEEETGSKEPYGAIYGGGFAGAVYEISMLKPYSYIHKFKPLKTAVADENGVVTFDELHAGIYKVKEIEPAPGHLLDENEYVFKTSIDEPNKRYFIYRDNSPERHIEQEIEKIGMSTYDSNVDLSLGGAVLELYRIEADGSETFLERWTTKADESHIMKGIPKGDYVIKETKAPKDYLMPVKDFYFTVEEVAVNDKFDIRNELIPLIETNAWFKHETGDTKNYKPEEIVDVKDNVHYDRVWPGKPYRFVANILDKATGEVLAKTTKDFVPEEMKGQIDVIFEDFDTTGLANKELVITEKLYRTDRFDTENKEHPKNKVAEHIDIEDEKQTLRIPKLHTTATDIDGSKQVKADKEAIVKDKVYYENLKPNVEYEVKGVLMDKATNKPLLDSQSNEIRSSKVITPETKDGFVELEFRFDASLLEGKTIVAFEKLEENNIEVAVHAEIDDTEQTVYIPKVGTKAQSKTFEDKMIERNETATLIDTIKVENLIVGNKYKLSGKLMNSEGKEVESEHEDIEFVATKVNDEFKMAFTFNSKDLDSDYVVVFEDLYMDVNGEYRLKGEHKDLEDKEQTVILPAIRTKAFDIKEGKDLLAEEKATVIDTVEYKNLLEDRDYKLQATIIDKNSEEIVASALEEFTAEDSKGTIDVSIPLDASELEGKSLVVYEEAYLLHEGEYVLITEHKDINDAEQTVYVPKIRTKATDKVDTDKYIYNDGTQTIVDTVKYNNLIIGKEYTAKATLMDKETNEPILDKDDNLITGETTFTAEKEDGTVDVEIEFDAKLLEGKTIVAFEKLYRDKKLVAIHEDIEDTEQTVYVPKLQTKAAQISNDDIDDFKIIVKDIVTYKNLEAGKEYEIKTRLRNKETDEFIKDKDGNFVEATKVFKAEDSNGEIEVEMAVEHELIAGKTVVVYEKFYKDDKEFAIHADLDDVEQTLDIPGIETTAAIIKDDKEFKESNPLEKITLIDKVEFTNLEVGKEYTFKGTLMDKETEEPIVDEDGEIVTATKVYTPESESGIVELEFTFDASLLRGKEIVAFEETRDEERLVAIHTDIEDESQTVKFTEPEIKTKATFKGDVKEITAGESLHIIDTVSYKGLALDRDYILKGVVMDKTTGKVFKVNGKELRAEVKFTPKSKDGTVEMYFDFDATGLDDKELVVFEELYELGKEPEEQFVTEHKDIDDKGQTVKVLKRVQTNAIKLNAYNGGMALLIAAAITVIIEYIRKKREQEN